MKKRTILSLAIAAILFTVIALHTQKEAIAETEGILPKVMVYTTDGTSHGDYIVELINLKTQQITILPRDRKGGLYPAIHGGVGGADYEFNTTDDYLIHVCTQSSTWGVNSNKFHMPALFDFVLTAAPNCPVYIFQTE